MTFFGFDALSIRIPLILTSAALLIISLKILTLGTTSEDPRPPGDSKREKRRAPRSKSVASFDLDNEYGQYTPGNARLLDISVWGACITSRVSLKVDQSIRGRIHSPTEGLLQVSGNVVWLKKHSDGFLYGIEFHKVTRAAFS